MKKKRSGILTKVLLIAVLIYAAASLITMSGKIKAAEDERDFLQQQAQDLENENTDIKDKIENSEDETVIEDVARAELGLVYPGEKVFVGE